jgi:hypothetical protein
MHAASQYVQAYHCHDNLSISVCLGMGPPKAIVRFGVSSMQQSVKARSRVFTCSRDPTSLVSSKDPWWQGELSESVRRARSGLKRFEGKTSRRATLLSTAILIESLSWCDLWNPLRAIAIASPLVLEQNFSSIEGFQFSFPAGWVVAYDRSGGRGNGAVAAVGDFSKFLVVTVFRQEIDDGNVEQLDEAVGRKFVLEGPASSQSTLRFTDIKSAMVVNEPSIYEFEYEIETCMGEIEEGSGGIIRCLASFNGQSIPTIKRHILGRSILKYAESKSVLLTIAAAAPLDVWSDAAAAQTMRAIIGSYRAQ